MKKLKIAMLAANFPPYFGGIGNVCYHNALELAIFGNDVTVFTRRYERQFSYPKEFRVVQLKKAFEFGNAVLLPGLLRISGFDVLHVQLPFHFGAELALAVSALRNIPIVVSYQMDLVGQGWLKHAFWLHEKTFLKLVLKRAAKIIASSSDYAQNSNFKRLFAARAKDVVVIPNGVDVEKFKPSGKDSFLLKRLKIKSSEKIVLFVGALDKAHYFKGVSFLLKAFSKIPNKNARLLIVGEGNLKEKYKAEAAGLGINERVVFAGRISESDLPKYYSVADCLVLPSIDRGEAFGIVLAEAMASGKPVIASSLPGVRDVVDNNRNGFLFTPEDEKDLLEKMNKLLNSKAICRRFGAAGRKKAEREFDWKKIAKKIHKTYLEALK